MGSSDAETQAKAGKTSAAQVQDLVLIIGRFDGFSLMKVEKRLWLFVQEQPAATNSSATPPGYPDWSGFQVI